MFVDFVYPELRLKGERTMLCRLANGTIIYCSETLVLTIFFSNFFFVLLT